MLTRVYARIYDKVPLILEKIQVENPAVLGGLGDLGG
jgi:hypothetical protein